MYISSLQIDLSNKDIEHIRITEPTLYEDADVNVTLLNKTERQYFFDDLFSSLQTQEGVWFHQQNGNTVKTTLDDIPIEIDSGYSTLLKRIVEQMYPYIEM